MMTLSSTALAWAQRELAFPEITYKEFQELKEELGANGDNMLVSILARNRFINTDAYNPHMSDLQAERIFEWDKDFSASVDGTMATGPATYQLQVRKSPFDFVVVVGLERIVREIAQMPVTNAEVEFAKQHYAAMGRTFPAEKILRWVMNNKKGMLPLTVKGLPDGSIALPGEVVATFHGPSELVALFEPVIHRIFRESMIATRARKLLEILGSPDRFIEVGLRSSISNAIHLRDVRAMYIGSGFFLTSNDAAPALYPVKSGGTLGHRYLSTFNTVEDAFRHAVKNGKNATLLVDLVNSIEGIDTGFVIKQELQQEYPNQAIGMRLDSGNIREQVRYFLAKADELGFTDPFKDKLVVEGIDSIEDIIQIEKMIVEEFSEAHRQRVVYGAGGLLIAVATSRSAASTGLKISAYMNTLGVWEPCNKLADSPRKRSQPGNPRLLLVNGQRILAQPDETYSGEQTVELFTLLYCDGSFTSASDEEKARLLCNAQYSQLIESAGTNPLTTLVAQPSLRTAQLQAQVIQRYER